MRIIFAGTPDFAASHLQALLDAHHTIIAVYTQPDRPAGRGNKVTASAVKTLALAHNLPVYQPVSLKAEHGKQELSDLKADLMIVVAYGLILPKEVLAAPKNGCINVHGSILPKWRGAAPIQRAIWAGDDETGVTIMQMDEGLDTGDVLSIHRLTIGPSDTSAVLYDKLAALGPKALVQSLATFAQLIAKKQDDAQATYASKLTKTEACVDWQLPAQQLERNIRAFNPWPMAWFTYQDKPIKVWQTHTEKLTDSEQLNVTPGTILSFDKHGLKIATAKGALVITKLQLAGKKPQDVSQIINGQASLFTVNDIMARPAQ
ncbi:MAG: methionyl-tRNA formyltransferase [Alphaproteobacteria bacterium]